MNLSDVSIPGEAPGGGYADELAGRKRRQRAAFVGLIDRQQAQQSEDFRRRMVAQLPARWAKNALRGWEDQRQALGETEANRWLLNIGELAAKCLIPPDANDRDICDIAKRKAHEAGRLLESFRGLNARAGLERFCRRAGIEPPAAKLEDGQAIARMTFEHWWRRRLRDLHCGQAENLARALGYIHIQAGPYCSNEALSRRQQQNKRNRATMEAIQLVCLESGEIMGLDAIHDGSLANKALRRAELLTRAKGFEEIALERGDVGLFITMTCPSRMHARMHKSGRHNPAYDGTTPRNGHIYLRKNWERIRAKFGRRGLRPYGLRIAEPHHDATPHWHMLMFVEPERQAEAIAIMRDYAMRESPDEPGADKHRFKVEEIRREKGSAVGYLVKYVCKNIDGQGVDADQEGVPGQESAGRAETWARAHGLRQFQEFGAPPVSTYRELRRVPRENLAGAPDILLKAHEAVQKTDEHQADYAGFIRACGGVGLKRSDYLLTVAKEEKPIQGRYGLAVTKRPVGVALAHCRERVFRSDRRAWQPFRQVKADQAAAPWTRVNNCTVLTDQLLKNPLVPWWRPEIEAETTGRDADGFQLGAFAHDRWKGRGGGGRDRAQEAEKRKGSNPSAPARLLPNHNRMSEAFGYGFQRA